MQDVYPELAQRRTLIVDTTRAEEERFLATIEEGMLRFDQLAPLSSTQGSTAIRGTISGGDAFRLYDTFGFPIDLTELMAHERGYTVDIVGFEEALQGQRAQSREERKGRDLGVADEGLSDFATWEKRPGASAQSTNFVGYGVTDGEHGGRGDTQAARQSARVGAAGDAVLRGIGRTDRGHR